MLPEFLVTCCCNSFQRSVFLKHYEKRIWFSVSRVTRRKHIFEPYGQAVYMESLESIQIIFHQRGKRTIVHEGSNHGSWSSLLSCAPTVLQSVFVKLSNYIQILITVIVLGVAIASVWMYTSPQHFTY